MFDLRLMLGVWYSVYVSLGGDNLFLRSIKTTPHSKRLVENQIKGPVRSRISFNSPVSFGEPSTVYLISKSVLLCALEQFDINIQNVYRWN